MSGLVRVKDCIEGIEFKQIEPSLKALAILLGLFSLFHVPELTNFTLSIDDEYAAFRDQPEVWITQGRWVAYLFERFVMPMPVVPFLPLALFGFFCSIGYLFFLRAIGERYATPLSFAFFPLFSSFPIWAHLTAFQSNTPSAALGVLLSCAAASLYRKEREQPESIGRGFSLITHIALIGFLGAAATACYQSFILFLGVALLASLISMHLSNRPARLLLKDFLLVLAILAISIILYMLILKFCLFITNVKVEYIQGFLRPEILFNRPGRVLSDLFRKLGNVYFGHSTVYGINARSFAVIFFLAAAGIVNRAYSVAGLRGVFWAILSILALMFVPFGINLMSGGIMPLRSLVAVPVAFAGLGLLGFKYAPACLSRVGILALLLAYFAIFQISSGFNAARQLVQVHDHEMAGAISERIAQVVGHANP
ncbi:MAG: glucosyltransferase domain-containing protein, partial [Syntrophobacter sp.]